MPGDLFLAVGRDSVDALESATVGLIHKATSAGVFFALAGFGGGTRALRLTLATWAGVHTMHADDFAYECGLREERNRSGKL